MTTEAPLAPTQCPGLISTPIGCYFKDSSGRIHDLSTDPLHWPGEAAQILNMASETVLRKVRSGQLYPVVYYNKRRLKIFACAIKDWDLRNRKMAGGRPA